MKIRFKFEERYLWIGVFWKSIYHWASEKREFEICCCFIPCCAIYITWYRNKREEHNILWEIYDDELIDELIDEKIGFKEEKQEQKIEEPDIGDSKFMDRLRRIK